jgi:hypothetical protein
VSHICQFCSFTTLAAALLLLVCAALVQELLHNKTQSAASRTRMLHMIRSSATCLLNTIDTTLSHNGSGSAGNAAGQHSRRTHKVMRMHGSKADLLMKLELQ